MKKLVGSLAIAGLISSSAMAGTITVAHSDLELTGALTAGFFIVDKTNNNPDPGSKDYFKVTSVDIELLSKVNDTIGFVADLGQTEQDTLITGDPSQQQGQNFGVDYAYVSIRPLNNLTIDAGVLTTNIGYELYHTYENQNIFFGMVWNAQPVTYPGVRITFEAMDNLSVYAEYNQDSGDPFGNGAVTYNDAFAVGVLGSLMNVDFAISYYDYESYKNLVDVVLSTSFGNLDVALNFDYQWMDDTTKKYLQNIGATSIDDHAYGVALYVKPNLTENISVPIRFEYVNDGQVKNNAGVEIDNGLYGVAGDTAFSITVTPTYRPSKNSYVRAEVGYVKMDNNYGGFLNGNGQAEDHRYVYAVEAGYQF